MVKGEKWALANESVMKLYHFISNLTISVNPLLGFAHTQSFIPASKALFHFLPLNTSIAQTENSM